MANCPIDDLEKALQPIGLWRRRAQSLKGLATFAAENHGRFPISDQELTKVPAVGQYVANAIMMFQHGIARPLLDVNMARVLERVVRSRRLADIRHDPWLQQASHFLVKGDNAAVTNWATLDFAAIVCSARAPECNACPFQKSCSHALNAKTSS
ncbi:MAG: hypothetical protein EOP84_07245 [Verrucomicrobiaceae bacterium]|nr:MAG: hypothetical protein EOP84_07245 [Verrucomicrobiaceae bacterium]